MSETGALVRHSVHTANCTRRALSHTQTLLFFLQSTASQKGNNKMSALKRSSKDNRQASTSPPLCGAVLCFCHQRRQHEPGRPRRRSATQTATRGGGHHCIYLFHTVGSWNSSWSGQSCELDGCSENENELLADSSQNACSVYSSQTVMLSLCLLDNRPACSRCCLSVSSFLVFSFT